MIITTSRNVHVLINCRRQEETVFLIYGLLGITGLSLRAGGRGFSPATKRVAPWLLLLENRRKIEPKEIPSRLIPRLLVVFTRQLEILVTTLDKLHVCSHLRWTSPKNEWNALNTIRSLAFRTNFYYL